MDLTVLIACKDRQLNLSHCLHSISNCRPVPATVVVDFGSSISLEPLQKVYGFLRVIRVTRKTELFHKARALNIGLRSINTQFVCATDADEVFHLNFFNAVNAALQKNPKAFVMCHTHFLRSAVTFKPGALPYVKLLNLARSQCKRTLGDGCCNGVRTTWLKAVHGWDEQYIGYGAEDSDLALRAVRSGLHVVWVHGKTNMVHLPHPKNTPYHSAANLVNNRRKYFRRKKDKIIVVNKTGKWGAL